MSFVLDNSRLPVARRSRRLWVFAYEFGLCLVRVATVPGGEGGWQMARGVTLGGVLVGLLLILAGCEPAVDAPSRQPEPIRWAGTVTDRSYDVGTAIAALTLPAATGGRAPFSYALAPTIPGLSFDADKRMLSGTPTAAGDYRMTYTATDAGGASETLNFAVTVEAPEPGPLPPDQFEAVADIVFKRFNQEREELDLKPFTRVHASDQSFIPVLTMPIACQASLREFEELQRPDLDGLGFAPWSEGTECALQATTYHYLPVNRRMRVTRGDWECFKDSRDIRDGNDVSCSGRYRYIEGHVKWLPSAVSYAIVKGESQEDKFRALIPWVKEKLGTTISKAASAADARLFLHLGVTPPPGCGHSYGCNSLEEDPERGYSAAIYVAAIDEFFDQVLKHELLHALLPMGHLPEGNHLMSVRPTDPSQTHTLSELEGRLLELYTHPYLREGMRMDRFRRYLVVE